jgi:hypothetical protein
MCRLATSVPPPRFHTVKYAGVLASASRWRARVAPPPTPGDVPAAAANEAPDLEDRAASPRRSGYLPMGRALEAHLAVDVLECHSCQGRMKRLAMVTNPASLRRYLAAKGELTEVPGRSPSRGPPYWKSLVLRRRTLGHDD